MMFIFFFKQKTAYEMRISDWSSDVCSSDLHVEGDIRDMHTVSKAVEAARPEIVFHLAAQPLVRYSYTNPVETYATNVMGTVHVLEACRTSDSARAVICVTTDKCYENREWIDRKSTRLNSSN